jgi:tRNA 2-thiouridine synthesizing protein E
MPVRIDKEGFLTDRTGWDESVAVEIAAREGIDLGATHWDVIRVARDFYARTGVAPEMRPLVKLVRERLGDEVGNSIHLLRLFPGNAAKQVAKIGGLPRPTNCL